MKKKYIFKPNQPSHSQPFERRLMSFYSLGLEFQSLRSCHTQEIRKFYSFQVFKYLCPKYTKYCFQNFGNLREDKNGRIQTAFGFEIERKFNFSKIYRQHFFHYQNQKSFIYVRFYLFYYFAGFGNKFLCILDTNVQKVEQIVYMNLLLFSSITCP